ncbi:MAG TPA: prepilin-type N-terminal cleavage/methylation domain-containing protein [Chthoniobacteraceae bacterium]|nr:prepilin-type N-terminal cleavage/methylation domain-containing protein [Chthoniobacteraceae bacterium]
MKTPVRPFRRRIASGFTLMEVVTALGIFSLCAVSLLALISFALEGVATSSTENEAMHLASSVFATLKATPFREVDCFGTVVDLSTAGTQADAPPLLLYAHFPADALPVITPEPETDAIGYRLELRFEPITLPPASAATANRVSLTVRPLHGPEKQAVFFQTIIADL